MVGGRSIVFAKRDAAKRRTRRYVIERAVVLECSEGGHPRAGSRKFAKGS